MRTDETNKDACRSMLVMTVTILCAAIIAPSILAQDGQKQDDLPPVQGPPLPGEVKRPEIQTRPQQSNPPSQMSRPQVVTYPIQNIQEYRESQVLDIPRHSDRAILDLEGVDYGAEVLATVGGQDITRNDFRRFAIILAGATELDQFVTYLLTKETIDSAIALGTDPSAFEVSEEELLAAVEEKKKLAPQFFQKSPEEWEQAVRDEFGWDRYLEVERVNLAFGKVFLPDYVEGLQVPVHTVKYLKPEVAKTIQDYYDKGNDLPYIFKNTFLNQIRGELIKGAKLDYFFEIPLPDEVVMMVDEKPVKVDEVWALFGSRLKEKDNRLILRDIIVSRATDQALSSAGFLISADEQREAFAAHEAEYEGTILPIQLMVALRGFSSIHKYREHYGRKTGFTSMLRSQYPGGNWVERLDEHHKAGKSRLSFHNGRVSTNGILIAENDPATGEAREGGLEGAIERARSVKARAEEDKENFGALLVEASDIPDVPDQMQGRFGTKTRYELKKALGETDYTTFLGGGYSLADEVFYAGTDGEIIGPVIRDFPMERRGAMLIRVDHFQRRDSMETLEDVMAKVELDFIDIEFQRFVHQAMIAATIDVKKASE